MKFCGSKLAFQCDDDSLIFLDHFCDGVVDCIDGSDELLFELHELGFQCGKCVLPQSNLNDDLAHCEADSDLCFESNNSCFECLDKKRIISSKQTCDGKKNCDDLSDECIVCDTPCFQCFDKRFIPFKRVCDGLLDCLDYSDECFCEETFITNICEKKYGKNYANCSREELVSADQSSLKVYAVSTQPQRHWFCPTKYGFTRAISCDGRPECRDGFDERYCNEKLKFFNDACHTFFQWMIVFAMVLKTQLGNTLMIQLAL